MSGKVEWWEGQVSTAQQTCVASRLKQKYLHDAVLLKKRLAWLAFEEAQPKVRNLKRKLVDARKEARRAGEELTAAKKSLQLLTNGPPDPDYGAVQTTAELQSEKVAISHRKRVTPLKATGKAAKSGARSFSVQSFEALCQEERDAAKASH